MQSALFIILGCVLLVVAMQSCATVQQYSGPACAVADEVCFYQHQLCELLNDTTATPAQVEALAKVVQEKQQAFQTSVAVQAQTLRKR